MKDGIKTINNLLMKLILLRCNSSRLLQPSKQNKLSVLGCKRIYSKNMFRFFFSEHKRNNVKSDRENKNPDGALIVFLCMERIMV